MDPIAVTNPANSEILGRVVPFDRRQVQEAVAKARKGFPSWSKTDFSERKRIIAAYCGLLSRYRERIAREVTVQMGKPITQSLGDAADVGPETMWFVENSEKALAPEVIDSNSTLYWDALGVVACIKAWNFPLDLVSRSAVPAMLMGSCAVLKHSELTPFTGRSIERLMREAGAPQDAFVLVEGAGETGEYLVDSEIDAVSFTGSSKVGVEIAQRCAAGLKKSVLELGGSTPAIVFHDADLEKSAASVAASRFNNCGQICSSAKRLLLDCRIEKEFTALLKEKAEALVVGDPLDPKTTLGPLASFAQRKRLEMQVADAKAKGGKAILGGGRPAGRQFEKGAFYEPTLIVDAPADCAVWREETFGPVLPIRAFQTE